MSEITTPTSTRTIEKLLAAYRFELAQHANPFEMFERLIAFASDVVVGTESDEDLDAATADELRRLCIGLSEAMIVAMARAGLATEVEGHLEDVAHARAMRDHDAEDRDVDVERPEAAA